MRDLTAHYLQYAYAAATVAPRTLLSVARGRLEPEIPEGTDFGRMRRRAYQVVEVDSRDALRRVREAYPELQLLLLVVHCMQGYNLSDVDVTFSLLPFEHSGVMVAIKVFLEHLEWRQRFGKQRVMIVANQNSI